MTDDAARRVREMLLLIETKANQLRAKLLKGLVEPENVIDDVKNAIPPPSGYVMSNTIYGSPQVTGNKITLP